MILDRSRRDLLIEEIDPASAKAAQLSQATNMEMRMWITLARLAWKQACTLIVSVEDSISACGV
jgi:hypothetical protein